MKQEIKNKYYVYVYLNPFKPGSYEYSNYKFSYEPFYIGKGCGKRLYDHLKIDKCNIIKNEIIEELLEYNNPPIIIKFKKYLDEAEAYSIEKDMINIIGRIINSTGPLSNIQPGGNGFKGWFITENWLKRNREGIKKRWLKKENHINLSKSLKKAFRCKKVRKKMSELMKLEWKDPIKREKRIKSQNTEYVKNKKSIASIKKNSLTWILISPKGKRYKTNRLKIFCKKFNLSVEPLQRVAMAKQLHHKKWICFKYGKEYETIWLLTLLRLKKILTEINRRRKLAITSTGRIKTIEEKNKIGSSTKQRYIKLKKETSNEGRSKKSMSEL